MISIYKQLAEHLDRIPNGYPATKSGVELKILAKLFTEEEAELALQMGLDPRSARSIAECTGREERPVSKTLKHMVKKGLIDLEKGQGGFNFKLIPFIVGFYERQNAAIDAEFAELFEAYYSEALYRMMTINPSVHRVIPVEKTIPVQIDILPYERASTYLEKAQAWGVLKCICRVQKSLIGEGCTHTEDNCLVFSSRPKHFDRSDRIRAITKEEALQVLHQAEKEGLVHSTNNVQDGVDYICNCCACSCGVLRGITEYGSLNAVAASDFVVSLEEATCTGCGICVDRCQFRALEMGKNGVCSLDSERCFGCGLCVSTCPSEALKLKQKSEDERTPPPVDETAWRKMRMSAREDRKDENFVGTRNSS